MSEDKLLRKKERAKTEGNLKTLANTLQELGTLYYSTEKFEEALKEFLELLEVHHMLNSKQDLIVVNRTIGDLYVDLGDYEKALVYHNKYLEGAKETKNLAEEQRAFASLGRTYFCWAETLIDGSNKKTEILLDAKKAYKKSLHCCDELAIKNFSSEELIKMRSRLLLNLSLVLEEQKQPEQAIELIKTAAELCKSYNFQEELHKIHLTWAEILGHQGDEIAALEQFQLAENVNNIALKSEARIYKVEFLLRCGHWVEARKILVSLYSTKGLPQNVTQLTEKYLRAVVVISRTEDNLSSEKDVSVKQKLYETLGDATAAIKCYSRAVDYYKGMLKCAEECRSDRLSAALTSVAQTLRDAGRYAEAVEFAQRELKLCSQPREKCRTALFLTDLLKSSNSSSDEIKKSYNMALATAEQSKSITLQKLVLEEFLSYLEENNNIEEAQKIKEQLSSLKDFENDTESEIGSGTEVDSQSIGADICLEDLSDVESELQSKDSIRKGKKRPKRGLVVRRNEKGETQLHVACINGSIENVEKLLQAGHPTNVRDNCGWTPLHEAANHDHLEIAKLLLENGANVNDPGGTLCGGITPLHDAACCGNLRMMRLLLQYNADASLVTKEDDTVLHCLESWKERAGQLSTEEQQEYNDIYQRLLAIVPSTKKQKKQPTPTVNNWDKLVGIDSDDEEESPKRISAGEMYKRTIATLKHRGSTLVNCTNRSKPLKPLLDSQEVLTQDWLEDDIGITSKRKSSDDHFNEGSAFAIKRKSSSNNIEENYVDRKTKQQKLEINIEDEKESEEDLFISEDSSSTSGIFDLLNAPTTNTTKRKRVKQISLLNSGFIRNSLSPSPNFLNTIENSSSSKPFESSGSVNLKVSVKNKTFHVKLTASQQDQDVESIVLNDVKEKFYKETGCTVKLFLRTSNGDTLNMENLIKSPREQENTIELTCEIVKMQIPLIVERYKTICETYNIVSRDVTIKRLKSCENTSVFRFKSEDINDVELVALIMALEYQTNLQILHLSGASLLEHGQRLSDSLSELWVLQELYLHCCDIDGNCLSKIVKFPVQLKILDLSYNPLGPKCEAALNKLLKPLKHLHSLSLRCCELNDFTFCIESNNLINLDVSWNPLDGEKSCNSLQKQLLNLNLSNTLHPTRPCFFTEIIDNPICKVLFATLETLEISCCDVSDANVRTILSQSPNLLRFILAGNPAISSSSINILLDRKPTLLYIDANGCKIISEGPYSTISMKNPEVCTLIVSMLPEVCELWSYLWQDRVVIHKLPQNLTMFKPI